MIRPVRRHAAACLVTGLLTSLLVLLLPSTAAAQPANQPANQPAKHEQDPLQVTIDRLTPSVLPTRGRITVAGTVTNASDQTWTDMNVYLVTSAGPIRTESELAEAAATDPATEIGGRLTDAGQFTTVPDLAPGESARYRLRLSRSDLAVSGEPGVYWLAVHVLGTSDEGRLEGADGRARTFVPLVRERATPTVRLALMVPFRGRVSRTADGQVVTAERWARSLGDHGRLGRLLGMVESAGSFPVTMVVDPAVTDLARSLAEGDPPYDIAPAEPDDPGENGPPPTDQPEQPGQPELPQQREQEPDGSGGAGSTAEDDAQSGAGQDAGSDSGGEAGPDNGGEGGQATAAGRWLDRFTRQGRIRDVLALPYGDVDVASAYRRAYGDVVDRAFERSRRTLADNQIEATSVVDPPDGYLPWEALVEVGRMPVVLSDTAVARPAGQHLAVEGGARVTLTDSAAASGGPGPNQRTDALALRQRILAEAALRSLHDGAAEPLVVQLPTRWDPGESWRRSAFFAGLDVPWLQGTRTSGLLTGRVAAETLTEPDRVLYPDRTMLSEIPAANFAASRALMGAGETLENLLTENDTIGGTITDYALLGSSVQFRRVPVRALDRTDELHEGIAALMRRVTVSGPAFVTMSAEDGPFQVTVVNGLDQPVRVSVRATSTGTDRLRIPSPSPVTVPAGARRSVRLHASSTGVGVWPVTLEATTAEGQVLGSRTELRIRSSRVGLVIWSILGVGSAALVVGIVLRVRRQVRARQATTADPQPGAT